MKNKAFRKKKEIKKVGCLYFLLALYKPNMYKFIKTIKMYIP